MYFGDSRQIHVYSDTGIIHHKHGVYNLITDDGFLRHLWQVNAYTACASTTCVDIQHKGDSVIQAAFFPNLFLRLFNGILYGFL